MIRQTDHTMPACDPSSCAGAVPARDRLRIVLQYSGERTYNALALRLGLKRSENLYRIRKGYNGISMDLALRIRNICPSLSLSWLLGGEGDPEAPDRTSAEAASAEVLYVPLYPDLLSWDRDFSAWGRSASSVSFLVVSRGRGGRFLQQRRAVAPSPARRLHASRPDAGRVHRVWPSLCRRCRGGPAVPDYPQGRVAGARPARFAETGQVRRNRRPENGDRRPLPDMRYFPVLGRLSG